jgi:anti-sigma factor RsiW
MSHSPYDDWLFSDEPRTAQESEELRRHLAGCPRCRSLAEAWSDVRLDLEGSPAAAPLPGFTGRWQRRLALDRQRRARRQSIGLLAGLGGGLGLALLTFVWLGSPALLRLPGLGDLIAGAVRGLANATTMFYISRQVLTSLTGMAAPAAILGGGGVLTAAAVGLIGAWLLLIYQLNLSNAQKGAQR